MEVNRFCEFFNVNVILMLHQHELFPLFKVMICYVMFRTTLVILIITLIILSNPIRQSQIRENQFKENNYK